MAEPPSFVAGVPRGR